jgi:hypothetical protein
MSRGGYRYGAGHPGWRRKCEQMLRFDIRDLRRKGRLSAGQSFGWSWSIDGEHLASISVQTCTDAVVLSYTWTPYAHEPCAIHCRVHLTQTPCNLGGWRTWFICPDCARPCGVLFGVSRRGNFACRVCQRLAYVCEAESPIDRCWRRQRKIEAKLMGDGGRPKRMHERTFERLCMKWEHIEDKKDALFWPAFLRLAERLAV